MVSAKSDFYTRTSSATAEDGRNYLCVHGQWCSLYLLYDVMFSCLIGENAHKCAKNRGFRCRRVDIFINFAFSMATIDRISTTAAAFSMKSSASATASNRWSRISAVFNPPHITVDYPPDITDRKIKNNETNISWLSWNMLEIPKGIS